MIEEPKPRRRVWLHTVEFVILAAFAVTSLFTIVLTVLTVAASTTLGARDVAVYWATAKQLVHHKNPYDAGGLTAIERSAGVPENAGAMFTRNPPIALPFIYILSPFNYRHATTVWSLLLLGCFVASIELLRRRTSPRSGQSAALVYLFSPSLICVINGQTSALALLGLALFLRFVRSNPAVAGAALGLCALKPHLFVPLGIVLLIDVVERKSTALVAGFAASLAAEVSTATLLDPQIWRQYANMLIGSGIENDVIPCLSYGLRILLAPGYKWVQYVPLFLATGWAVRYFCRHRSFWDWRIHGVAIVLVSVLAAPYCWLYDLAILVPVVILGLQTTRSRSACLALAAVSALIEIFLFLNAWRPAAVYLWTLWAAPAIGVWYLVAMRRRVNSAVPALPLAQEAQ